MAHDTEKRREARKRYIYDRQDVAVIAIAISIPEPTVRRWKQLAASKGDNWDTARSASAIAGDGLDHLLTELLQDYITQHAATLEDLRASTDITPVEKAKILAGLSDSFIKTVNAAGRISPKISELGVAMDVLKKLVEFTSTNHPALAEPLLEVIGPFGDYIAKHYG